jgi:hypothetical protein
MERSFTKTGRSILTQPISGLFVRIVSVLSNIDGRSRLWIALVVAVVATLLSAGQSYAAIGRW